MEKLFPAEGPEIKLIADNIKQHLYGAKIYNVNFFNILKTLYVTDLMYDQVIDVRSKGKQTYIQLSKDNFVLFDPRVSGYFSTSIPEREKTCVLSIETSKGTLFFNDLLKNSRIYFLNREELESKLKEIAWDSIDEEFEDKLDYFTNIIQKSNSCLGVQISGYSMFSSLGIFLKSESFYENKISPYSISRDLSKTKIIELCETIQKISRLSYNNGGIYDQFLFSEIKSNMEDKINIFLKKQDRFGNLVRFLNKNPDYTGIFYVKEIQEVI